MTDTYSTHSAPLELSLRQAFRNLLDGDPYELDLSGGQEAVAEFLSVDDILDIRPDLGRKQAWELLKAVRGRDDTCQGILRDEVLAVARELYGDASTA
jgi:hypothetical protein